MLEWLNHFPPPALRSGRTYKWERAYASPTPTNDDINKLFKIKSTIVRHSHIIFYFRSFFLLFFLHRPSSSSLFPRSLAKRALCIRFCASLRLNARPLCECVFSHFLIFFFVSSSVWLDFAFSLESVVRIGRRYICKSKKIEEWGGGVGCCT